MRRPILIFTPLVIAFAVALLLTMSATATTWSDPAEIANPAKRPDVAIDANGEIHFVWINPDRGTIQYRHCTAVDTCDNAEKLPNLDGDATSPALALDSQNRPNVVWEQVKGKKHTIYFSRRDAGVWTDPVAYSNQPESVLPDIAIGSDDVTQVVYESVQNNGRAIYYVTEPSSQLPSPPRLVELELLQPEDKVASGRNVRIAVDGDNHAHVVWNTAKRPFAIKYVYQDSNGNFVAPKIVADKNQDQTPDLSIDAETNRVGIIWETRKNDRAAFVLLENGVEVFRKNNVEGGFDTVRRPRLATDCGGNFHLVFQREKSDKSDWNIYYREFDPNTETFTDPLRLTESQKDDAMPALTTTDKGVLAFITGRGGILNAMQAEIDTVCHGQPTPTPTLSPTIPSSGWEHIANHDARIVYTQAWNTVDNTKASDGNFARCETNNRCQKGASAKIEFTGGTRIEWETAYANTFGKADVLVDGKVFERVDLCSLNKKSAKPKFGVRTYILSGDANTAHSLEIKFIGHSNCSDVRRDYVAVDGFNILR